MTDIATRYIIGCGFAGSVLACMNLAWEFKQKKLDNRPTDILHPLCPLPVEYVFKSIPCAVDGFITGLLHSVLGPATVFGYVFNAFAYWASPALFIKN